MVADFDAVFDILKCDYSVANFLIGSCSFSWWEKMLQNLYKTLTERGRKTLEKEVRIGFADSPSASIRQIMPEEDIV